MGKNQLIAIFIMAMFFLPAANAVEKRSYLLLYSESRDTDVTEDVGTTEVSGFGMEWRGDRESGITAIGLTVGKMTSDQTISAFGDRNIGYPIFVHVGFNMPYRIAPYFEYGIELGAAVVNEQVEGEEANTDTYLSGGLLIQTKAILIKLYAKEYHIKPYNLDPVDIYVTGLSIGLEF